MPWNPGYSPDAPEWTEDSWNLDEWLNDNGYSYLNDDLTVGEGLGDWTSSDPNADWALEGLDNTEEPVFWSDMASLYEVAVDAEWSEPVPAHMFAWSLDNPDASNEEFAAELFTQMFNSASQDQQDNFVESWNDAFTGDQISTPDGEIDVSQAAAVWANTYGGNFLHGTWFTETAISDELAGLMLDIGGAAGAFNEAYGEDFGAAVIEAGISGHANISAAQLAADELLDGYLSQIDASIDRGENLKDQYMVASRMSRAIEAGTGTTGRRSSLLDEEDLSLRDLQLQLEGVNQDIDANVADYQLSLETTESSLMNYLTEIFGAGGLSGNYEEDYTALLGNINNLINTFNMDVNATYADQVSLMYAQLENIATSGGYAPPSGGGFDVTFGDITGEWWLGDSNCVTDDLQFGFTCPSGYANEGMCVGDISECGSHPDDVPMTACADGSMIPSSEYPHGCEEYEGDFIADCFSQCGPGQILDTSNYNYVPGDPISECPPCIDNPEDDIPDDPYIPEDEEDCHSGCFTHAGWCVECSDPACATGDCYTLPDPDEDECEHHGHCPPGQICMNGNCITPSGPGGPGGKKGDQQDQESPLTGTSIGGSH